jgi:UDPglucose 6-dehydrogenase
VAEEWFKKVFPESEQIKYFGSEAETIAQADIVVIATDWPQFRELGSLFLASNAARPIIMDGRRILAHQYDNLQKAGFKIIAVGSKLI